MKHNLDVLNSINKVETPYYVYAKILHKVNSKKINTISFREMLYLSIPCLVILLLVVLVISNTNSPKEAMEIAKGMNLTNNNNLY